MEFVVVVVGLIFIAAIVGGIISGIQQSRNEKAVKDIAQQKSSQDQVDKQIQSIRTRDFETQYGDLIVSSQLTSHTVEIFQKTRGILPTFSRDAWCGYCSPSLLTNGML